MIINSGGILYQTEMKSLITKRGMRIRVMQTIQRIIIQKISQPLQGAIVRSRPMISNHIIPRVSNMIILFLRRMPNIIDSLHTISEEIPSTKITINMIEDERKIGLMLIIIWKGKKIWYEYRILPAFYKDWFSEYKIIIMKQCLKLIAKGLPLQLMHIILFVTAYYVIQWILIEELIIKIIRCYRV